MAEAMVNPQRGRSLLKSLAIVATAFLAGCQTLVPKGPPPVETTAPPPETRPPVEQGIPTDTERNRVALLVPLAGTNAGVGQSIANATMMALLDSQSQRRSEEHPSELQTLMRISYAVFCLHKKNTLTHVHTQQ